MSSPYGQHHDSAHSFVAPEPHLPLRRSSSQKLYARRQGQGQGPRPLFAPQQHHLRGFNPTPVAPIPQINNVTASSEHAFAGRDDKRPFKPPLGVQALHRSVNDRPPPQFFEEGRDWERSSKAVSENGLQDNMHRLRSSKSVGDGMRRVGRRSSRAGFIPPSTVSSRSSSRSATPNHTPDLGRGSLRSARTNDSGRFFFAESVHTNQTSRWTDDSSMSNLEDDETPTWPDTGQRTSFDVDDAIGLYEVGFDSVRQSIDFGQRKLSLEHRPATSSHQDRPNKLHRRSHSASILDRVGRASTNIRASRILSAGTVPTTTSNLTMLSAPAPRDRYGFKKMSHQVTLEQYDAWNKTYQPHLDRRKKKWYSLMKSYGLSTDNPIRFPPKSEKIKRYIRKGIPPDWRGAAWFWYAGGPGILKKRPNLYNDLLRDAEQGKLSENDREHIERDLNRTFPDNLRFKPETQPNDQKDNEVSIVKALRRVLQAFAVHKPSIGYCQSLNFIAGLLLLFLNEDEEKSFILLELITTVHLPGTHGITLEGANIDIAVLMSCIKDSLPNVWAKLDDKNDAPGSAPVTQALRLPTVSLATTAWFMSLYVGTLPMEGVLRTWDCLFFEGSKTLFRMALAIFKAGERQISSINDPMEIFQVVQTLPRTMLDINSLMDVCFRRRGGFGYLSQDVIERRREEKRKDVKAGLAGAEQGSKKWKSRWRSKTIKQ